MQNFVCLLFETVYVRRKRNVQSFIYQLRSSTTSGEVRQGRGDRSAVDLQSRGARGHRKRTWHTESVTIRDSVQLLDENMSDKPEFTFRNKPVGCVCLCACSLFIDNWRQWAYRKFTWGGRQSNVSALTWKCVTARLASPRRAHAWGRNYRVNKRTENVRLVREEFKQTVACGLLCSLQISQSCVHCGKIWGNISFLQGTKYNYAWE